MLEDFMIGLNLNLNNMKNNKQISFIKVILMLFILPLYLLSAWKLMCFCDVPTTLTISWLIFSAIVGFIAIKHGNFKTKKDESTT